MLFDFGIFQSPPPPTPPIPTGVYVLRKAKCHDVRESKKESLKWKEWHEAEFHRAGVAWPPLYTKSFHELCIEHGLTAREAEYLHYLDRMCPMELLAVEDEIIDVSQSLGRESGRHAGRFPCVTPQSRLWLRRRRRWVLAPVANAAQGYDSPPGNLLRQFTHRQVIDLVGNSFHGDSCLAALAVALSSAPCMRGSCMPSGSASTWDLLAA